MQTSTLRIPLLLVILCYSVLTGNAQSKSTYIDDGPYVIHTSDILDEIVLKTRIELHKRDLHKIRNYAILKVKSDRQGYYFTVQIEKKETSPSTYPAQDKIAVISDIEGNFSAFRELLISSGVIDNHFLWAFGDGHLVITGDIFDRGEMVTETLWLIYELEREAKKHGGKVHFLLGNHEIMNLTGDHRYVNPKYHYAAEALDMSLTELYSNQMELGHWLRTKNVIEKIGDYLFVHGGISPELNKSGYSLDRINKAARAGIDTPPAEMNQDSKLVLGGAGPLWFRGYYSEDTHGPTIEQTLSQFKASKIITGHTIVADSITSWYGNQLINVDTPHSQGKSEALLIENGIFYRIKSTGEKILLFKNEN